MSDQCIFFWIIWAVYWLEDNERNKRAADEKAFRLMIVKYPSPHIDFVIEFGGMIDGEFDSDTRVMAFMRILELRQKGNHK